MNLLQLEYFQEVAKAQSITKAAKLLGISQSALSIMMNKLETEIGYPLFSRQGRSIAITPMVGRCCIIAILSCGKWTISNGSFESCKGRTARKS